MTDAFEAQRLAEEIAQRELFKARGIPFVMDNPDVKVVAAQDKPDVYKVAETELLRLKMKVTQGIDLKGSDRNQLANLIHVLISQGES